LLLIQPLAVHQAENLFVLQPLRTELLQVRLFEVHREMKPFDPQQIKIEPLQIRLFATLPSEKMRIATIKGTLLRMLQYGHGQASQSPLLLLILQGAAATHLLLQAGIVPVLRATVVTHPVVVVQIHQAVVAISLRVAVPALPLRAAVAIHPEAVAVIHPAAEEVPAAVVVAVPQAVAVAVAAGDELVSK
jgi:hypothetical protein